MGRFRKLKIPRLKSGTQLIVLGSNSTSRIEKQRTTVVNGGLNRYAINTDSTNNVNYPTFSEGSCAKADPPQRVKMKRAKKRKANFPGTAKRSGKLESRK